MLVLVIGTTVAFSSCSKDDDNGINGDNSNYWFTANDLIGTWTANGDTYQFLSGYRFKATEDGWTSEGTWSFDQASYTVTCSVDGITNTVRILSYNGDQIQVLMNGTISLTLTKNSSSSSSLVGLWKGTIKQGGETFSTTLTINSDNTYSQTVSTGQTYSGRWSISGNTLSCTGHFFSSCTYSLNGNTLYMSTSVWSATLTRQ